VALMEMFTDDAKRRKWWSIFLWATSVVLLAVSLVGLLLTFRDSPDVREGPGVIPDGDVDTLDIAGDKEPEFVQIGRQVFAVPETKTWFERWGTPFIGAVAALIAAVLTTRLNRQTPVDSEQAERLERIELLLVRGQAQAARDGADSGTAAAARPTGSPGGT
jgi:hypothetical protein